MTRKKVKLEWIVNETARKASFKKRKLGLLKKMSELSTLCGVSGFVIIYGPDDNGEPAMWPPRPAVEQLLVRFQSISDLERSRKMMNNETYLKERAVKLDDQFQKHHKKNKVMEMAHLMHQIHQGKPLDDFDIVELRGLFWLVEEKVREIGKRMKFFHQIPPLNRPAAKGLAAERPSPDEMGQIRKKPMEGFQFDQWFLEMMKNNENNNSIAGGGNGGVASIFDMGQQLHGNIGGGGGFGGASIIGGGGNNSIGGLLPSGNLGFGSGANDLGLPHVFWGESSGASEAALSFESNKNWHFSM